MKLETVVSRDAINLSVKIPSIEESPSLIQLALLNLS
jgi:hypothetical protein